MRLPHFYWPPQPNEITSLDNGVSLHESTTLNNKASSVNEAVKEAISTDEPASVKETVYLIEASWQNKHAKKIWLTHQIRLSQKING